MALETGTYISDLVSTNPVGTDTLDKADDHLRLLKSTIKTTFPNITGAVTATHTELNLLESLIDSTNGRGFLRNRIINGDMRIDQRNAGASVTPAASAYTLDRWELQITQASKATVQQGGGITGAGFSKSIILTTAAAVASPAATDYFSLRQGIEGFNVADLEFGTASAKSFTLSFWVQSTLTGNFGGSVTNGAANRSYPFTYNISAANTWQYKTITIPGDTSGTWLTTNGAGLNLFFTLGAGSTYTGTANTWAGSFLATATGSTSVIGTLSAALIIAGVQLEAGSYATPFERRQYGTELALCQRYYQKSYAVDTAPAAVTSVGAIMLYPADTAALTRLSFGPHRYVVQMRATPTVRLYGTNGSIDSVSLYSAPSTVLTFSSFSNQSPNGISDIATFSTSATSGTSYLAHYTASAEL